MGWVPRSKAKSVYTLMILLTLASAVVSGCAAEDENTRAEIARIEADLAKVRVQIAAADADAKTKARGFLQSVILARLETLRLTEALLDQRRIGLKEGVTFDFRLPATQPNVVLEKQIANDLAAVSERLKEAEAEAARYTGGLIQAMALLNVATEKQTIAMLGLLELGARYGLITPSLPAIEPPRVEREPAGMTTDTSSQPAPADGNTCPFGSSKVLRLADWAVGRINSDTNRLTVSVENIADQPIKMVDASVLFGDILGGHIARIGLKRDIRLKPHESARLETGPWGPHTVERLLSLDKGDVKATVCVEAVLFQSGERLQFE